MVRHRLLRLAGVAAIWSGLLAAQSLACTADKMKTTENGFIYKVVGGSDKVEAKKEPGSEETAFILDLLAPYFVICEEDQFFKITDQPAETVDEAEKGKVGYVLKEKVHAWPTREALNFSAVAFTGERPEIVAWDDPAILDKFMDTGNLKLAPATFHEDLASTLKRERSTRPYPVLSSEVKMLRKSKEKRVFDVLLPVALPPDAKVVIDPTKIEGAGAAAKEGDAEAVKQVVGEAMTSATFCIVFDATGSMADFARDAANDIKTSLESIPPEVAKASSIGFVFYRDEGDEEKNVVFPPMPVADAIDALSKAATVEFMKGGGDDAEPVLDAVYIGEHLFPWSGGQGAGKRIMIAVLNSDAKPATTGGIEEKVPPGLDAQRIASDLLADGIKVITVQAGPGAGENLVPVLSTLGETSGGTFIAWGDGGDERRKNVTAAVAAQMSGAAVKTFEEGKEDLSKMEFDFRGYATIPLAVMDGEKLQRLRAAGVNFNIDPGKGGVLIQEGYMLENDDLLEPQIQVEKKTLDGLINLFSVLGTTGVDVDAMKKSASEALAAIAGEDVDPNESIEETIKKRLGIQFRTKLLDFNLEYLAGMNQAERLAMTKRIQDAGNVLGQFMEAHLEDFGKNPAVWMPVAQLP